MKFHALHCPEAEKSVLTADHSGSRHIGNVHLGKLYFYFKVRTNIYYIPYESITRCFRRVELVPAKMCCGKGDFEVENVVICGENEEEIAQIQLPGTRAGVILQEALKERMPNCIFGKKSSEEAAE